MQQHPIPRLDVPRRGYFLCREDALAKFSGNKDPFTDLTDLSYAKPDGKKKKIKARLVVL